GNLCEILLGVHVGAEAGCERQIFVDGPAGQNRERHAIAMRLRAGAVEGAEADLHVFGTAGLRRACREVEREQRGGAEKERGFHGFITMRRPRVSQPCNARSGMGCLNLPRSPRSVVVVLNWPSATSMKGPMPIFFLRSRPAESTA